jgi:S1-C subfamily serine protease
VNSAIISGSGASAGIGFAIPVDVGNRIAGQLIRDGRVPVPGIALDGGLFTNWTHFRVFHYSAPCTYMHVAGSNLANRVASSFPGWRNS